jgi:hypothetical protein
MADPKTVEVIRRKMAILAELSNSVVKPKLRKPDKTPSKKKTKKV